MEQLHYSVVIPAHNEESNLRRTVEDLQTALRAEAIPHEIILINDNSTDGTGAVIAELMAADPCIKRVECTPPGGFGRAVRRGLEIMTGDAVVICMADSSDAPHDVVAYYRKLEEGYDCVFGSRFIAGSRVEGYPFVKWIVNRIVNRCIQLMFWCRFNDLTNAFKAYRTEVIETCGPYRACHFNLTIEMSLGALVRKYSIAQVPISWFGRTWGSSKLSLLRMGRRYLATLLKVYAEKLLIGDDVIQERLATRRQRGRQPTQLQATVAGLEQRVQRLQATDGGKSHSPGASPRGPDA